jgi:UDP-N-acetylmuramoyl-tripeptide--D-alanyl-D-alanine ligase
MDTNQIIIHLQGLIEKGHPANTDSRNPLPGAVFFALKGDTFDGNDFAGQALQNGCSFAVIDKPGAKIDDRCLLVDDVLSVLQQTSTYHRTLLDIPVIGITGSNGKTTTKELCHAVLSKSLHASATAGNLNNHIGVPLTILSFTKPIDIAIVEMGANHIHEIASLCEIARPHFGLITNIGKAHLEGFGSYENIIRAKSELYHFIRKQAGTLFVHGDDELLMNLSKETARITYGKNTSNHCSGRILSADPFLSISYQVNKTCGQAKPGEELRINSHLAGDYNFSNIMAAVTIGLYFGVKHHHIKEAIESYLPSNNRSQISKTKYNTVLIDAYNANPSSMHAAVTNFRSFREKGKTAVLLGDMLEMGSSSVIEHQNIYRTVMDSGFDLIILVGKEFSRVAQAGEKTLLFDDIKEAASWLMAHPIKNHYILLKGSRGIQMETLLKHL